VPAACLCCGGSRLRKIGEDVTETLELVPRQWKVIQHVREKLVCRACEAITQPPTPSHPIARGHARPRLLAYVLFAKYGLRLPLHRQSDVCQREGMISTYRRPAGSGPTCATTVRLLAQIRWLPRSSTRQTVVVHIRTTSHGLCRTDAGRRLRRLWQGLRGQS
jgi:transposase